MMRPLSPNEAAVNRNVEILKALANPQRLRIALMLSQDDHTVGVLAGMLGLRQCITSQQLGILRMSGIVEGKRVNGCVRYKLIESKAKALMHCLSAGIYRSRS
jgi:ArsR family transcriptional regulator, virulence genes transcriptional regulator